MKRPIPSLPGHSITRDGKVFRGTTLQVFPSNHRGAFGANWLVVEIDMVRHYVWRLLSEVWYENKLPLTRDGSMLNFAEDNTFTVKHISKSSTVFNADEIIYLWYCYRHKNIWCLNMSRDSGITRFTVDEFRVLITDILKESVK